MQTWQLQNAKARFSELVKHAADQGPQEITVHGQPVAVLMSREMFDQLSNNSASLVDFMRQYDPNVVVHSIVAEVLLSGSFPQ